MNAQSSISNFQFSIRGPVICWFLLAARTAVASAPATYEPCNITPPSPAREFRAAWVATVANIDWPSRPGLSTTEQQAELLGLLDRAAQLKLNAIIFQVRPACDALYASRIEPWSEYLTGTMGRPPEPFYDPLAFAIAEAHKRGLELHAWFNPYRARLLSAKSPATATHISKTRPHLVRAYGKFLWLDPGEKEVQDYSLSVILDVVHRYDLDGVHFDDYFYPYPEKDKSGREPDFPDDASWQRSGARGKLTRDDWRRQNVNSFIERVYRGIKAAKPWVKFGVAPFGIWRPGVPPSIDPEAFDAYAKIYADSRKWLASGWLDYFSPQLYWPIQPAEHSFPVLLKWWAQQNTKGRHLWPGLDTGRGVPRPWRHRSASQAATATRWTPDEIENQIRLTRQQSGAGGHIHWSMKSLLRSRTLADALAADLYTQPALVPASPWLSATRPGKPLLSVANGNAGTGLRVSWQANSGERAARWVLQTQAANGEWSTDILPAHHTVHELDGPQPSIIAVTAVDRLGNLGPPAAVGLEPRSPPQRLSDEQPPARKRVAPRFASPKERS